MSVRTITFFALSCDKCGREFGKEACPTTDVEARAAAYGEGWRFPPASLTHAGRPKDVFDLCPGCVPETVPEAASTASPRLPRGARGPRLDAEKLTKLRRDRGLNQTDLAELAKVSAGQLSRLEAGERTHPSPAITKRLADALGVGVFELLADGWDRA